MNIYLKSYPLIQFNKKQEEKVKGALQIGAGGYIAKQSISSGVPRALGVRIESHTTSRSKAKKILSENGFLDPKYGGTGAAVGAGPDFVKRSTGYVHITGVHEGHYGKRIPEQLAPFAPLYRAIQRRIYKTSADNPSLKGIEIAANIIGPKRNARTLYVGGSDKYFYENFEPDPDDLAIKSKKPIKVHPSKLAATLDTLNREGGGNKWKGARKLMKANPKRVGVGLAILAGGGLAAKRAISLGVSNIKGESGYRPKGRVKSHFRKLRNKMIRVKSFIRGEG
jgi:hypothetical protein